MSTKERIKDGGRQLAAGGTAVCWNTSTDYDYISTTNRRQLTYLGMSTKERIKDGGRQLAAGGTAGFLEVCLMQPLELVKTRLQIDQHYKGMWDCVARTYKSERILGFYKGILPPLLVDTPKRATRFFTFEQYKSIFSHPNVSPILTLPAAGLCCGLTESFLICPFEVVKVRQQAERNVPITQQKSTMAMAREIMKHEGMGTTGIYRGLSATLGVQGAWNMIYFGVYHNTRPLLPDPEVNPGLNLFGRIVLGFAAGCLGSTFNIPFDVAKSRIQGPQPNAPLRMYNGTSQTITLVFEQEGWRALFNGLLPKVMRGASGGAIIAIVYERVYEWLKKNT